MQLNTIREYCLNLPGAFEDRPFDHETIVMKVGGKIYTLFHDEDPVPSISLKCDPDHALALRAMYQAVKGGYHLNKKHWNTVTFDGSIPPDEIFEMIDDSYELVFKGLKKSVRESIGGG